LVTLGKKKVFFFEKKNQKTFVCWVARTSTQSAPGGERARAKVFWFFFSKKNPSFFLAAQSCAWCATFDPDRCGGRPCLRELRIRVMDVLDLLAAGAERAEIVADYPLLEREDMTAALEYAAQQSGHPVLRVA